MGEKRVIFYDLETNGKRPFYQSAIMQIALRSLDGGYERMMYVFPYDNVIGAVEIHSIDEQVLRENSAITSAEMIDYLMMTFPRDGNRYYFVAYNNFGFDQNVLEYHFRHHGRQVPANWYFVDLYPYVMHKYAKLKGDGGYKLKNVYEKLCLADDATAAGSTPIQFHNAFDDVYCLSEIYKKISPTLTRIRPFTRGSYTNGSIRESPISALSGYASFFNFERKGITTMHQLYQIFEAGGREITALRKYLKEDIGIYSNFYLDKICEQIEIYHDLLG